MRKLFVVSAITAMVLAGCSSPATSENSIIVGLECDYAPFNWTQLEATATSYPIEGNIGYCDGYDITVASRIADELGLELVVKQIAWEGLQPALVSGEIDMIVAGMTDTAERRQVVAFSQPYYASDMVLIVRNDSPYVGSTSLADFTGANVVAQRGTFHVDLIDQIPSANQLTPLASFPLLVNAVQSQEADAMVSERPVAVSIVNTNPNLVIIDFAAGAGFVTDFEDTTVSVAVRQSDTQLLADINRILSNISTELRNQWMNEALSRQPEGE